MNMQDLFNIAIPLVCGVLGWFCRELWNAVKELKEDLAKLRAELPTNYISKNDFNDRWEEILKAIHRVENKIDRFYEKK